MPRKIAIAGLVLGALGLAIAGWVSCHGYQCWTIRVTRSQWFVPHLADGLARLFWVSARGTSIELNPAARNAVIQVHFPPPHGGPPVRPAFLRVGRISEVPFFGYAWHEPLQGPTGPMANGTWSMFRVPLWVPVTLMLIYPTRAFYNGPILRMRRRKNNQCPACGYSVLNLPEPRCPECGTKI